MQRVRRNTSTLGDLLRDYEQEPYRFISCGGGVHSVVLIHKAIEGELKVDAIIMADPGIERPETIELIESKVKPLLKDKGIPFHMVTSHLGPLQDYYISKHALPLIGTRHCTSKFKIRPIRRFVRSIVGNRRGKKLAECLLGITTDEGHREGESDVQWMVNEYPFIEWGMSRQDCIDYLNRIGWDVVKSGCVMCPYQSGQSWIEVRDQYPDLFQIALDMEKAYFDNRPNRWKGLRYDGKRLTEPLVDFAASKCSSGGCFI